MKLHVYLSGRLDRVAVSSLPKAFAGKIFRHCMGKNNTPYFANNCFKGVIYFDQNTAKHFASQVGYTWNGWSSEDRFLHTSGLVLESNLEIKAVPESGQAVVVNPVEVGVKLKETPVKTFLDALSDDEILIVMGSVDKATEDYVLDGFTGPFDPEKLACRVMGLEELLVSDKPIIGLEYDGAALTRVGGRNSGLNMLEPVLLSKDGKELDLYDFQSESIV